VKPSARKDLHVSYTLREYASEGPPTACAMESMLTSLMWDGKHARAEQLARTMVDHFHAQPHDIWNRFDFWLGVYSVLSNQTVRAAQRRRGAQ
jgi:hypothetical protein